ncbi:MAG: uroporphyrinogen decarboxylase family protein [candidate division KSB1 bacterium]|nr:uroporphyrinogen decarboxylase family protein [candidate division KSB1 bacterium]
MAPTAKSAFELAEIGALNRPLFEPAIYEHKAALLQRPVVDVATSAELLAEATLMEIEHYHPDAVTIGVDVYNVEAEAIGCRLNYDVPRYEGPQVAEPLLGQVGSWTDLPLPDAERAGRMPLFLEAASRVLRARPPEILVRGAVSGPFSLAATLVGFERLLLTILDDASRVRQLLNYTLEVSLGFGLAYLRRGAEPVYFDSRCAPPLLSPRMYAELVLPVHAELVRKTRAFGARQVPLIIGGDTTEIVEDLVRTGAGYLLCDAPANFQRYREALTGRRLFLRRNLNPVLIHRGPLEEIEKEARAYLQEARGLPLFVLGTGIVAYDTPPQHIVAVRRTLEQVSSDGGFWGCASPRSSA